MNIEWLKIAAGVVAVLLFTANWWWPWLRGLFTRKPAPSPDSTQADLYPQVVALRGTLSADTYNALLVAVCGKKADPKGGQS